MVGFNEKAQQLGFQKFSDIPEHLVYEEWDGVPILYRDIHEYAPDTDNLNQLEMGSSVFQSLIIEYILGELYTQLDRKRYAIITNEAGLQLGYRNTLSNDIALVERSRIPNKRSVQYATVPPNVVIEVDVKADYEKDFRSFDEYMHQKTQKLLAFGVEKVIWVLSADEQEVRVSTSVGSATYNWKDSVMVLDSVTFCLAEMNLE